MTRSRAITWSRDERIKSLLLSLQDDTLYAVGPPVSDHPKCEGFGGRRTSFVVGFFEKSPNRPALRKGIIAYDFFHLCSFISSLTFPLILFFSFVCRVYKVLLAREEVQALGLVV